MKKTIIILALSFAAIGARAADKTDRAESQIVNLTVTEKGFQPNTIDVGASKAVTLKITRKTNDTCATQINIPLKKIKKELPLNKEVSVELGKLDKGEIRFACGMDMVTGIIHVK